MGRTVPSPPPPCLSASRRFFYRVCEPPVFVFVGSFLLAVNRLWDIIASCWLASRGVRSTWIDGSTVGGGEVRRVVMSLGAGWKGS